MRLIKLGQSLLKTKRNKIVANTVNNGTHNKIMPNPNGFNNAKNISAGKKNILLFLKK